MSEKRSHLKRERKIPTKLLASGLRGGPSHQNNDLARGVDLKAYKKGLFERRLNQLVRLHYKCWSSFS